MYNLQMIEFITEHYLECWILPSLIVMYLLMFFIRIDECVAPSEYTSGYWSMLLLLSIIYPLGASLLIMAGSVYMFKILIKERHWIKGPENNDN